MTDDQTKRHDATSQLAEFGDLLPSVSTLAPATRYITTHDKHGKSIIHSSPPLRWKGHPTIGGAAKSYISPAVPAPLEHDTDVSAYLSPTGPTSHTSIEIVNPGTTMTVVELAPSFVTEFHRTPSIDYVTVTNGHVLLELDGGETVSLKAGDHIVQRATMHRWRNGSDEEPCRFVAVVVPAVSFEIPGSGVKMVVEEHLAESGKVE